MFVELGMQVELLELWDKSFRIEAKLEPSGANTKENVDSWKITSLDTWTLLVAESKTLYPFILKKYPTNMCGIVLGSNLSLRVFKVVGKHRHPKLIRWEYVGCVWYNNS